MGAIYAVPHALLLQGAVCDLARFYQLPSWGYAGCGNSKVFDEQAVMEGTIFTLMGALQGCNLMHDVFYIESGRTGSLEMLLLSDEVISRVRSILGGIDTSEEYLAVDAVRRVGPGGNFLGDPHTVKHFRENWKESISDFNNYNAWVAGGSKTMGDRIRGRLREIEDHYQPVPLSTETRQAIDNILRRAEDAVVF
jgi:trimethylamine--corrinoid protein Co-methyltransferase